MKTIKGFENEDIKVSDFGEWVGKDYIDYKFEYKNNQKLIKTLFEENQELKKQLEVGEEQYNDLVEEKENLQEQLSSKTLQLETQQKEFIEYLENEINELTLSWRDASYIPEEILSKYKEIIGENK